MKNSIGKYLLVLFTALVVGCGGGATTPISSDQNSLPETDMFGQLSVDVKSVLPGTWRIEILELGVQNDFSDTEIEEIERKQITFGADGSLSELELNPIYSISERFISSSEQLGNSSSCEQFIMPDGIIGQTSYRIEYGQYPFVIHGRPTYEVTDTGVNTIISFNLTGDAYRPCCKRPLSYYGNNPDALDRYNNQCNGADQITHNFSKGLSYIIVGAKQDKIAFVNFEEDFLITLIRVSTNQ